MNVANPFCPPRLEGNPHQPLRPWDDGCEAHTELYVSVDDMDSAFDVFAKQSGGLETLVSTGRLVVVTGRQGCGKTSLINRCTWHSRTRLQKELKTRLVIADITGECTDSQSVPDRVRQVATMLIDHLEELDRPPLVESELAELRRRLEKENGPARMYHRLSQQLKRLPAADAMVLAVLLPPSADLEREILLYADFVGPRLLFFAETSFLKANGEWRSKVSSSVRAVPLVLPVGPLKKSDCWEFAQNRLRLYDGSGVPRVEQGVMDLVYQPENALTVGHLQRLMFGVYEELLSQPKPPDTVTLEHIYRYILRTWRPKS